MKTSSICRSRIRPILLDGRTLERTRVTVRSAAGWGVVTVKVQTERRMFGIKTNEKKTGPCKNY